MMADFCIPKGISTTIKSALKAGRLTAAQLYGTDSDGRLAIFQKLIPDKNLAAEVHSNFEADMIATQQKAISKWIEGGEEGTKGLKSVSAYIHKNTKYIKQTNEAVAALKEYGLLNPGSQRRFLKTIVETSRGAALTPKQLTTIGDAAKKVEDLSDSVDEYGIPSPELHEAVMNLDRAKISVLPTSPVISALNWGRSSLLLSTNSVAKAWAGQGVSKVIVNMANSLVEGKVVGANPELAGKMMQRVMDDYKRTGINILQNNDIDTVYGSGDKQAKLGPVGQIVQDKLMRLGHGAPHINTYATVFFRTADIDSTKLASQHPDVLSGKMSVKEKAAEIMSDATHPNGGSEEGSLVRASGKLNAEMAANLADTPYSKMAIGFKRVISDNTSPFVANWLMPLTKVAANVAGLGTDIATGFIRYIPSAIKDVRDWQDMDEATKKIEIKKFGVATATAGIGTIMSYALVSMIGPNNFAGLPAPSDSKSWAQLKEEGAVPNSFKVFGHWIPAEFFGPLAPSMMGMAYARKYGGNSWGSTIAEYGIGVSEQAGSMFPGVSTVVGAVQGNSYLNSEDISSVQKWASNVESNTIGGLYARLVPSFVGELARVTDPTKRDTTQSPLDYAKSEIPGVRETLPAAQTETGETLSGPGWLSGIISGSSTANESYLAQQFQTLANKGKTVSIQAPKSNTAFQTLKSEQGSDAYNSASQLYYTNLQSGLTDLFKSDDYKVAPFGNSDDGSTKEGMISNIASAARDTALYTYGYTPVDTYSAETPDTTP